MTAHDWLRVIGCALFCLGAMCLPGSGPKGMTSAFIRTADTGIWLNVGVVLMIAGLAVFLLSWILPKRR